MASVGCLPPLHVVIEADRLAALQPYLTLPAAEPLLTLVRVAAHLLRMPVALISLIDRDHQWVKAAFGTDMRRLPRPCSICSHAIDEPSGAIIVPDTLADRRFRDHPLVLGPPNLRFYAGVSLIDDDGYALGTICVMDDKPSSIGPGGLALLREMAVETVHALALQRAEQRAGRGDAGSTNKRSDERCERDRQDRHWHHDRRASDPALPRMLQPTQCPRAAHGWLGVRTEQSLVPGGNRQGRHLIGIAAGSPAERAGLRIGDIILAIDGRAARRRNDLTAAIASCPLGGVMRLHVWRKDTVFDRDVRLAPMPNERTSRGGAISQAVQPPRNSRIQRS